MKNNTKGLSLTELLVSSMLIGIVMLGVIGFNVAITTMQDTTQASGTGSVNAATAISILRRDIQRAVGELNNQGIRRVINGSSVMLFLRMETAATADDYSDDPYVCWEFNSTTRNLIRYEHPAPFPAAPAIGNCQGGTNTLTLGQLSNSLAATPPQYPYTINTVTVGGKTGASTVSVDLRVRPDSGAAADPVNNPESRYTTTVSPDMHPSS